MSFVEAFEAVVAVGAAAGHAERVAEMRRVFEGRTGAFGPEEAWFEARSRAFWDDALTRQGFAEEVLEEVPESARGWACVLGRAHRGLFTLVRGGRSEGDAGAAGRRVLRDVWGGAEFIVDTMDEASVEALAAVNGPFDGRIAATLSPLSVALLPGAIFHPADAIEPMQKVLAEARSRSMDTHDVLDALLRMERSLRTLSRVKPAYAYRPESLVLNLATPTSRAVRS